MESNVSKVLYEESIPVLVNSVSSFIEERGYAVEKLLISRSGMIIDFCTPTAYGK